MLPDIVTLLSKLSKESYLKDKGSAYRYTQSYKLQLMVISNLAAVVSDLEMGDGHVIQCVEAVAPYLSNRQPVPLQVSKYSTVIYREKPITSLRYITRKMFKAVPTQVRRRMSHLKNTDYELMQLP